MFILFLLRLNKFLGLGMFRWGDMLESQLAESKLVLLYKLIDGFVHHS